MAPTAKVAVERLDSTPLAVVFGKGAPEMTLAKVLAKQHLRVLHLADITDNLSVLEKPAYIFFFADDEVPPAGLRLQFSQALESATRFGAKFILVSENTGVILEKALQAEQDNAGWPVVKVEMRGRIDVEDKAGLEEAASKLVRLAFASHQTEKVIILGKERPVSRKAEPPERNLSVQDVFDRLNRYQRKKELPVRQLRGLIIVSLVFLLLVSPLFLLGVPGLVAYWHLEQSREALSRGKFVIAQEAARQAKDDLAFSKSVVQSFNSWPFGSVPFLTKYFNLLTLGETAADIMERGSALGPKAESFASGITSAEGSDTASLAQSLHKELAPIDEDLGQVEALISEVASGQTAKVLSFFGFPVSKIAVLNTQLPSIRATLNRADKLLAVWPEIVPPTGRRTYMIVFQNSAELRPTGGFIGSYGLVRFNQGKLLDWKILDIYSADGQLRGQISPPDELLHFLNQPSWYMRDSNWSPDWPLSAKRLAWFLEKETGDQVDGVVAVNLGAAQRLLVATGPLALPDLNQTVTANDFFQKAEYASEIDFFAGSTQKRDFLGSTAKALLTKLTDSSDKNWPAIGQALTAALNEKDVLFFFNSLAAQKAVLASGWAGTVNTPDCEKIDGNCLLLTEANLGLNKANYFVRRRFQVSSIINKGGNIETTVMVQYQNDSPSNTWPGGTYKNYLRFLVPAGSKLLGFDLGDGRQPVVSPVLTGSELQKVALNQFFVFQNTESTYTSYGALMEIPIQTEQTVSFRYSPPTKVIFGQNKTFFSFDVLKQPGTGPDQLDFILEYPSFMTPVDDLAGSVNQPPLVFPQKLIYNSNLATDRQFRINFKTGFSENQ